MYHTIYYFTQIQNNLIRCLTQMWAEANYIYALAEANHIYALAEANHIYALAEANHIYALAEANHWSAILNLMNHEAILQFMTLWGWAWAHTGRMWCHAPRASAG